MKSIYLDYNATTPLDPAARAAMAPFLDEHFGNPSSAQSVDRMKRLTPDSRWWHRVPHRKITRSVAQGEGGRPWTILASICINLIK